MGCNCGKPKCDGHCNASPAVLQINNPSECVLFHKVDVPASMGDSTTNPPQPGAYRNVLLHYEADDALFIYSSDGAFVRIPGGVSDYEQARNLPSINGVTIIGARDGHYYGLQNELIAGENITIGADGRTISAAGCDQPLVFRMQYTEKSGNIILPGWSHDDRYELVRTTSGSPQYYIYKTTYDAGDSAGVTFLNEKTSQVITPQELYDILLDGSDVVLNHVPLGFRLFGEWADASSYADGIKLTRVVAPDPYDTISFSGSAFVDADVPDHNDGYFWVQSTLGVSISGYEDDGEMVFSRISVQGYDLQDSL